MGVNYTAVLGYGIDLGRAEECDIEGKFGTYLRETHGYSFDDDWVVEEVGEDAKARENYPVTLAHYDWCETPGVLLCVNGTSHYCREHENINIINNMPVISPHLVERFLTWCEKNNVPVNGKLQWILGITAG